MAVENTVTETAAQLPIEAQYSQAGLAAVLALFGAYIALRQWRTSHQKLKLDLFEKRWDVYEATRKFCGEVAREYRPDIRAHGAFWEARDKAQFLFGKDVNEALNKINNVSANIKALGAMIDSDVEPDKRPERVERQHTLIQDFHKQIEALPTVFEPYLTFKKLK